MPAETVRHEHIGDFAASRPIERRALARRLLREWQALRVSRCARVTRFAERTNVVQSRRSRGVASRRVVVTLCFAKEGVRRASIICRFIFAHTLSMIVDVESVREGWLHAKRTRRDQSPIVRSGFSGVSSIQGHWPSSRIVAAGDGFRLEAVRQSQLLDVSGIAVCHQNVSLDVGHGSKHSVVVELPVRVKATPGPLPWPAV